MQIARRFSQMPSNGSVEKLSYELHHNVIMFKKQIGPTQIDLHKVDIQSEMQEIAEIVNMVERSSLPTMLTTKATLH